MQRLLQLLRNLCRGHIQEVLGRQTCALTGWCHTYLGNGIHVNIDEVLGRNTHIRLDIHGNLTEVHDIQTLKEGDAEAAGSNKHTRLLGETGDNVGIRGRCLHIGNEENNDKK